MWETGSEVKNFSDLKPSLGECENYLLSSIFYLLSSIFYLLSSIFYLLSSIFYLLSSIFNLLYSIFNLLSLYVQCIVHFPRISHDSAFEIIQVGIPEAFFKFINNNTAPVS